MSMEDLILRLRVEEDHIKGDKADAPKMEARANVVEGTSLKQKFHKSKAKKIGKKVVNLHAPKGKDFKKIKGNCWVCGKSRHRAQDFLYRKDQNASQNVAKSAPNNQAANVIAMDVDLVAVISEINMISNVKGWWVDTRATRHIYGGREESQEPPDGGVVNKRPDTSDLYGNPKRKRKRKEKVKGKFCCKGYY
ncbi:hypothetical protein LWI29_028333 [Acer saccharum]|uniref:Uncharacterized protein n=1 Tax=Acer saccharum TaxID=4024 RepID=A0AA39SN52_ACESA|nr:hypothetical protein LWI29_028333 [Acer saccharum]